MNKQLLLKLFFVSIGIFLLTACGKVPQAQIDVAQAAIDSAKIAEAELYIPDEFKAIQDSFAVANENIEKEKSKFFKNFDVATKQLEAVADLARKAQVNAVNKKNEVKQLFEQTITEVQTLIAEDKELLGKAPKGKEEKAALEAIQNDITLLDSSVVEASAMFTKGEYMTGLDKIKSNKEKAVSINTELKAAIEKACPKKK